MQAGVQGRVTPLVTLLLSDFAGLEGERLISASTVVFLNNYGIWFESQHPDHGRDLNKIFCDQVCKQ